VIKAPVVAQYFEHVINALAPVKVELHHKLHARRVERFYERTEFTRRVSLTLSAIARLRRKMEGLSVAPVVDALGPEGQLLKLLRGQKPRMDGPRRRIPAAERSELPPAFNAYQKLESAPNQRCLVIHSSEGSSARKRLVVNVNCQSHRTLQHQIGPIFTIRRCADQNLSTLTLIQRQSRATPSRDPAAGSSV